MATTGYSPTQLAGFLLQGEGSPSSDLLTLTPEEQAQLDKNLAPLKAQETARINMLRQAIGVPQPVTAPATPTDLASFSRLPETQRLAVMKNALATAPEIVGPAQTEPPISGFSQYAQNVGKQLAQTAQAEAPALRAGVEAGVGVATSIPAFFAGLGEMGSTILNRAMETIAERGPVTARSAGELARAQPGDFYTSLRKQFTDTMQQYSYEPRSEEGRRLLGVAGMLPGIIQGGAEKGKEALVARGVKPEDADSIALSLELLGFLALEPVVGAATRGMRGSISRFRAIADRATSDAALATPEAVSAARDLAAKVNASPETTSALQQARQRLIAVLDENVKQREQQAAQATSPLEPTPVTTPSTVPSEPAALPELDPNKVTVGYFTDPNVSNAEKVLQMDRILAQRGGRPDPQYATDTVGWFNDPRISDAQKQQALQGILAERATAPLDPNALTVGYFTNPRIPDTEKIFQMDQILARRGGRTAAQYVEGTVGWFNDPRVTDAQKQQVFDSLLGQSAERPATAGVPIEVTSGVTETVPRAVPRELEYAEERMRRAEAAMTDPNTKMSLAVRAREFRAASADLARLRQTADAAAPGPTAPAEITVDIPPTDVPSVADTTASIKKPRASRQKKVIAEVPPEVAAVTATAPTPTEPVPSVAPPVTRGPEPGGVMPTQSGGLLYSPPPTAPAAPASTGPQVQYHPIARIGDVSNAINGMYPPGVEGTSPTTVQLRTAGGAADAILFDPTGLNTSTSIESIRQQVAKGRMSPEAAQTMENDLRRQAQLANVPVERAHNYTGDEINKRLMRQALDNNLEFYEARRTSAGTKYEQVTPDVMRTRLGLADANPLNPVPITGEAAGAFVADKTRPVGPVTLAEIQRGLETLDEGLAGRLPEDVRDPYLSVLNTRKKGMNTSEIRTFMDFVKDVMDVIVPPDIVDPNSLQAVTPAGPLALFGLSPARREAALRLWADATKRNRTLKELLDQTNMPESEKLLLLRYVNSIDKPPLPEGVRADRPLGAPDQGDFVWSQRAVKRDGQDVLQTPVHFSDALAIQGAKELRPVQGLTNVGPYEPGAPTETASRKDLYVPFYALRRANLLDPVMYAYRAAERAGVRELAAFDKDLEAIFKSHNKASRERIGADGYAASLQGMNILIENGRDAAPLNSAEQATSAILRRTFDEMWLRVNEVREAMGKPLLEYVDDYMPFMRVMSLAEKTAQRINLTDIDPQTLLARAQEIGKMDMKRAETRTGAKYKAEFDAAVLARDFMQQATEQIHLAPFIAKLDELVFHEMPDINTGKPGWKLSDNKPRLYEYLRDWRNFLVNGTTNSGLNPTTQKIANRLMSNVSLGIIGLSARSAMLQFDTLLAASHAVGPQWLMAGIGDAIADVGRYFFSPEGTRIERLMRDSQVMDTRGIQDAYTDVSAALMGRSPRDFLAAVRSGGLRDISRTLGPSVIYKTMEIFDHAAATVTGLAATRLAEHVGLSGRDLTNFVDDVIVRTNGGTMPGDVAGIQRSTGGRMATQMQRFLINDWNYLIEDVLGAAGRKDIARLMNRDPDRYVPAVVKSALSYAATISAYNILMEDVLGVQTNRPAPIRTAINSQQAGDDNLTTAWKVALNLTDPLPLVGSVRYGIGLGGPVLRTIGEVAGSIAGTPLSYKMFKEGDTLQQGAARLYGSPLARLAGAYGSRQVGNFVRGADRDMGFWPSLMGFTSQDTAGGGVPVAPSLQRPGQGVRRIR